MPVIHISAAPSRALYESVRSSVDLTAARADGLLLHSASSLPEGEVRIVDVYADMAACERADARMRAAFAAAGITAEVEARPQPEITETFDFVR